MGVWSWGLEKLEQSRLGVPLWCSLEERELGPWLPCWFPENEFCFCRAIFCSHSLLGSRPVPRPGMSISPTTVSRVFFILLLLMFVRTQTRWAVSQRPAWLEEMGKAWSFSPLKLLHIFRDISICFISWTCISLQKCYLPFPIANSKIFTRTW